MFFLIKHTLDYQYGTIFRRVIDIKPFDWCAFMDGQIDNVVFRVCYSIVAKTAPQLAHKCPYKGETKALNVILDAGLFMNFGSFFPQGKYRTFWILSDNVDSNIFTLSFDYEVKSPIKSSFG